MTAGILILLLILVALVWFGITNTETDEGAGGWFGSRAAPVRFAGAAPPRIGSGFHALP